MEDKTTLETLPPFVRSKDLAAYLGVAIGTIGRWIKSGKLPKPIKVSTRCIGWNRSTIYEWLEQLEEESQKAPEQAGEGENNG